MLLTARAFTKVRAFLFSESSLSVKESRTKTKLEDRIQTLKRQRAQSIMTEPFECGW